SLSNCQCSSSTLAQGSFLTEDQVRSVAPVVVSLNPGADLFGKRRVAVGQTVRIKNQTLT
ncbi:ABC transporter permease, partial [Candidatus Amarolinea dominans]|uniref:ABC transporter permease n=1 Tax=Candidatus Amarolinea dominans TaxID=3140696 RepID=UPI001D285261|nr:ABC transporter permease [Anaerolineae bacterium]